MRQGDVGIQEIKEMPEGLHEVNNPVLALGEATGHSHTLNGKFRVFENGNRTKYIQVEKATLVHQEHNPIQIDKGLYEVQLQREYDVVAETRRVMD